MLSVNVNKWILGGHSGGHYFEVFGVLLGSFCAVTEG
jgi:hypothetical protein